MIEILPNWHPVFVHFTIALLSMSVVFFLIQAFLPEKHRWQVPVSTLSKANLWLGTGFAIITAIAGWFAYNSVSHDTPSHAAMTDHRNWALATLAVFIILAFWSALFRHQKKAPTLFVIAILIAGGLLASTGWHGAEAVYRYGLGVMSIPKSTGEGHAHKHAEGEGHGDAGAISMPSDSDQTDAISQSTQQQDTPSESGKGAHSHNNDKEGGTSSNISTTTTSETKTVEQLKKDVHDSTPHSH